MKHGRMDYDNSKAMVEILIEAYSIKDHKNIDFLKKYYEYSEIHRVFKLMLLPDYKDFDKILAFFRFKTLLEEQEEIVLYEYMKF